MLTAPDHILVVDDEPDAREGLADLLQDHGYRVTTAGDGLAALAAIEQDPPGLVISDVQMPRADGYHLVRGLRASRATAHVPILLLSALGEPQRRANGLDMGADDYLAKPVDARELLARVRAQFRRSRERAELERRSLVDPLTGVMNRRGIAAVLQRELARAGRTGGALSVLMVDVDRFKQINDIHGHPVGDVVLRHVARALDDAVRTVDNVGRFGGDEFLVVLSDTDGAAAEILCNRLRVLRLPPLAGATGEDVAVSISIGVATMRAGDTPETLIERADLAMYQVKRSGRARAPMAPRA